MNTQVCTRCGAVVCTDQVGPGWGGKTGWTLHQEWHDRLDERIDEAQRQAEFGYERRP